MAAFSQRQILIRTFKSNKTSVVGLFMALVVVMIAFISPWLSPYDPISQDIDVQHAPPSWAHPFGTDSYGRDQLSRILWGARVSLVVGIFSVLFAMTAGIPLGMLFHCCLFHRYRKVVIMIDLNITGLFSWFSSLAGKFLSDNVLKFAGYKILLFSLLTVTLPVIIKNSMTWLFEQIVSIAQTNSDFSDLSAIVLEFFGFAGYLATHLLIPDCVSVLLTAVAIRAMLNFIPFVG